MDSKSIAVRDLQNARHQFLSDLKALPDDAFTKRFGPATRTVADIVYEVNLVNDHVGIVMRGEEPFEWPEGDWITAPSNFQTKDEVISGFEKSMDRILETAESFSPEEFESPIDNEGKKTNRFERCRFMTVHLWYHSGQLNFIQTLLGDDGFHWK